LLKPHREYDKPTPGLTNRATRWAFLSALTDTGGNGERPTASTTSPLIQRAPDAKVTASASA